jgi:hypothetical protein
MKNAITVKTSLLILAILTTFVVFFFKLSIERAAKKAREIERIESHSYQHQNCVQYALVAAEDGWFPCYNCGTSDSIYLYKDEVWKYGKTCFAQQVRYPNGLPHSKLEYFIQIRGTEKECLIAEKEKIYNYPNLPECLKRNIVLIRPAGNKIDR